MVTCRKRTKEFNKKVVKFKRGDPVAVKQVRSFWPSAQSQQSMVLLPKLACIRLSVLLLLSIMIPLL